MLSSDWERSPNYPPPRGAVPTHGLVIHHFRRSHQRLENDPGFATVDDIVHVIAQMYAATFQAHWGRIRISRADFEVRCPLVETMHLPLLPTFLRNPVVPSCILCSQFLVLCCGEDDGHWQRCGCAGYVRHVTHDEIADRIG
jgi:hypothetical protein